MNRLEFLQALLPKSGVFCSVGIKNKAVSQKFHTTIEAVANASMATNHGGGNAYFAMASFDGTSARKQVNAVGLRCVWLDVDCGEGKPYTDQTEGLEALGKFIERSAMPVPMIVNSGNGLHVYWRFDEEVPPHVWSQVSTRLSGLTRALGLSVDSQCTTDAARVLRVIGTTNTKGGGTVDLIHEGEELTFEELAGAVLNACAEYSVEVAPEPQRKTFTPVVDPLTQALAFGDTPKKVSFIKLVQSESCNQITQGLLNPAGVDEPTWRGLLSIAKCCEEPEAIHWISENHPGYAPAETEYKASLTSGAYSCATFDGLNEHCRNCAFRGSIKNALTFGSEYKTTDEVPTVSIAPEVVEHVEEVLDTDTTELDAMVIVEREAAIPFGYSMLEGGGILRNAYSTKDGEVPEMVVYENDLFLYRRVRDEADGECLMARLILPKDGARDFMIPMKLMGSSDELRKILGHHGVAAVSKQLQEIMMYLSKAAKELQKREVADSARAQMGWTPENSFVVGEVEVTQKGDVHCPTTNNTNGVAEFIYSSGDLDSWKDVWRTYAAPGFELHAFAALTGFGAPLMKFTGQPGGLINLASNASGTGKTTTLMMAASVWGDPRSMLMLEQDKPLAKVHKMGVLNTLPFCIDEITNMDPEEVSELCYGIYNGKGRDRMMSATNGLRVNRTRWNSIGLSSSNSFLKDKLAVLKSTSEGEQMRLLEINLELAGSYAKVDADRSFSPLLNNFGTAGVLYARYLVRHHKRVKLMVQTVQEKLDIEFAATNKERVWSGIAAANICGGLIACELGLISFDMKRIQTALVKYLRGEAAKVKENVSTSTDILGEFLLDRINATLVIDDAKDKRTGVPINTILREPKGNMLSVRFEVDAGLMYITKKDLKLYCVSRQVSFTGLINSLRMAGKYTGECTKRMAAGTSYNIPPVSTIRLVADREDIPDANTN